MTNEPMTDNLKKWIEATFLMYIIGVQIDLLLIGHYESFWQYLPILALPVTLVFALLHRVRPHAALRKAMRIVSVVLCGLGALGIYFHIQSNFEFELEMRPTIAMAELWQRSMTGALPVLAPASMVPLGLLNYVISELKN